MPRPVHGAAVYFSVNHPDIAGIVGGVTKRRQTSLRAHMKWWALSERTKPPFPVALFFVSRAKFSLFAW